MLFLIACVISTSLIFVIFKLAKKFNCHLFNIILINYFVATFLGLAFLLQFDISAIDAKSQWLPFSVIVGILFAGMFFFIGISSQKAGVAVTSLANKISMVFPILFSILIFHEKTSGLKIVGLSLAFVAVVLILTKKNNQKIDKTTFFLPIIIFVGSGLIDTIVKYAQHLKVSENEISLFTTSVFFTAFIAILIANFVKKNALKHMWNQPTIILGLILGTVNYGSLYFLMMALQFGNLDSSLVFAINNMSIVALTTIIGFFVFNEQLNKTNFAGIIIALASMYLLTFY